MADCVHSTHASGVGTKGFLESGGQRVRRPLIRESTIEAELVAFNHGNTLAGVDPVYPFHLHLRGSGRVMQIRGKASPPGGTRRGEQRW